jgi:hypothetical protein
MYEPAMKASPERANEKMALYVTHLKITAFDLAVSHLLDEVQVFYKLP